MAPVKCIFLPLPQKQVKCFNLLQSHKKFLLNNKYVFERLRGDYLSDGERYVLFHFSLLVAELASKCV